MFDSGSFADATFRAFSEETFDHRSYLHCLSALFLYKVGFFCCEKFDESLIQRGRLVLSDDHQTIFALQVDDWRAHKDVILKRAGLVLLSPGIACLAFRVSHVEYRFSICASLSGPVMKLGTN